MYPGPNAKITKQLHDTVISLDEIGTLPDEIYGDILFVFPSAVMKTFRQSSSIFYLRRELITFHLVPSLQLHPMVLLLNPLLRKPSVFSVMQLIPTTTLQPPSNV